MTLQSAINKILAKQDLTALEMTNIMQTIMTGGATDAQIGGFLIGLRMKGETVVEITAAAKVMRQLASGVNLSGLKNTIDIVGTGGDSSGTFNISTASMFVAAAAGCIVAKHGNRSVSSNSGAADVLEAMGINLNLNSQQVADCVAKIGLGFMFAPAHHSAMKHAIMPRKEMAVRTIFNVLGPLTNPAAVPNQLLGVFNKDLCRPLAEVLQALGSQHVMVVHSDDGMDEISIAAKTQVCELKNGGLTEYQIDPVDYGLAVASLDDIKVANADESLTMIQAVLDNQDIAAKNIVVINAGAAIYCAGLADNIKAGITLAQQVIENGKAREKMLALIEFTKRF